MENKLNRHDLIYITGNKKNDKTYHFEKFKTIRSFGRQIYDSDLSVHDAFEQQIRLKDDINILQNEKNQSKKEKAVTLKNAVVFLDGRQKVINAFEYGIFPKRKQRFQIA